MRAWTGPPGPERGRRPAGNRAAPLDNSSFGNSNAPTHNRSISALQVAEARRLRRQRLIERLCKTPRLIFELLDEIARHHDLGEDLDRRLGRYTAIDPALLAAIGGDQFPPSPLRAVGADP